MADLPTHIDSIVMPDLAAENEFLQLQSKEQIGKIEALNQEVHTLRNRLEVALKVQADCLSEVESMQEQQSNANASHCLSVSKLKEEYAKRIEELEHQVHSLERDLLGVQEKYEVEHEQLRKTRKELNDVQEDESIESLKVQLQELLEEHASNRVACIQHQELNKILLDEKTQLHEELCNTREHLELTEEKLKIFTVDLNEQSETLEELRESLAIAQNELSCVKANPSDSVGRGNSLFAEVEDKRQSMLKKCSSLSKKYHEMKKDYSSKCSEISRLRLENMKLRRKWQEEEEERDKRDVWLNDNYEIRIKELTKMMEDLKKEEKAVFINGDSKILTYAENVVEGSRRELAQLRDEMEWRSSERLNEAKALYTARCEMQNLKTQMMSLQAENLVLRDRLQKANISDIPSPGKTYFKEVHDQSEVLLITSSSNHQIDSSSEEFSSGEMKILKNDPPSLKQKLSQIFVKEDELLNEQNSNSLDEISTKLHTSSLSNSQTKVSTALSLAAEFGLNNAVESPYETYSGGSSDCSFYKISGSSPSTTDHPSHNNLNARDSLKHESSNYFEASKITCAIVEDCKIDVSKWSDESAVACTKSVYDQSPINASASMDNIAHFHSDSPYESVADAAHCSNDGFTPLSSELASTTVIESPCDELPKEASEIKVDEIERVDTGCVASKVKKPQSVIKAEFPEKHETCRRLHRNEPFHLLNNGKAINEVLLTNCASNSVPDLKIDSNHADGELVVQAAIDAEFVYPHIENFVCVSKAETKENVKFLGEGIEIGNIKSENDVSSPPAFEETCTGVSDEFAKVQNLLPANRRSILTKVSRPSLVPLDQNMKTRKVSFAVSETTEITSFEPDRKREAAFKEPAKKRLTRLPQPKTYKTRVIVSKENDDD